MTLTQVVYSLRGTNTLATFIRPPGAKEPTNLGAARMVARQLNEGMRWGRVKPSEITVTAIYQTTFTPIP